MVREKISRAIILIREESVGKSRQECPRNGRFRRILRVCTIVGGVVVMVGCGPTREAVYSDPDVYSRDYYFFRGSVQIQGRGTLPDRVQKIDEKQNYLDLGERRQICKKEALQNAHTKWLSLTRVDPQDQKEWQLRLSLGARKGWIDCLEEAEEIRTFYDGPDSCRVVMLYDCRPQSY